MIVLSLLVPRNLLMRKIMDIQYLIFNDIFVRLSLGFILVACSTVTLAILLQTYFNDTIFTQTFLSIFLRIQSLYTSMRAQYLAKALVEKTRLLQSCVVFYAPTSNFLNNSSLFG